MSLVFLCLFDCVLLAALIFFEYICYICSIEKISIKIYCLMETRIKNIFGGVVIILLLVVLVIFIFLIFKKTTGVKNSQQVIDQSFQQNNQPLYSDQAIESQFAELEKVRNQTDQEETVSQEIIQQQLNEVETLRAQALPEQKIQVPTEEEVQNQLKQLEELQKIK